MSGRELAVAVLAAGVAATLVVGAVERWSLSVGALVAVALGVTALLAVTRRRGVDRFSIVLVTGAVATSPANAVSLGIPPGPALLAVALVGLAITFVRARTPVRIPAWVWPLPAAVVLVGTLHVIFPTNVSYLAGRFVDGIVLSRADLAAADVAGAVNGAQWLVSLAALPIAVCLATVRRPGLPGVLVNAWAIGATASAAVSLTDEWGLTSASESLLDTVDVGGRQAGLSVQPNHLALTAAFGLTVAVWRMLRTDSRRVLAGWALAGATLVGGLVVSESRGGFTVAILAVAAVLLADHRSRGALPALTGLGVATVIVVLALVPDAFTGLAEQLRFSGADSAQQSDTIRRAIANQAVADFLHSPLRGVGLEVIAQGHNIYLELLASGGVLLLIGFGFTAIGGLLDAWALRAHTADLSALFGLCTAAWLAGGLVENQITDLYLYVPLALLAGLRAATPRPAVANPAGTADRTPTEPIRLTGHPSR